MAFSFALTQSSNDYSIKKGRIALSIGSAATVDRVYTRIQTERGEWFLDNTIGVPYYGDNGILGNKRQLTEIAAVIRKEILGVAEVDKINQLNVTRQQRVLSIDGDIQINGSSESVGIVI